MEEESVREKAPGTILCLDNHEAERQAIAGIFRQAGFEVKWAATGDEAVALARKQPALLFLVAHRPDLNGFEVCRRIRAHPATAAIPVLFLFGSGATAAEERRAREEGGSDCMTSPVNPQELLARTRALLFPFPRPAEARSAAQVCCRSGLTKAGAEALLDWLEANGRGPAEVVYKDGEGFCVRWRGGPTEKEPGNP
jgi:DNA-binding response OmpR family regulator